MVSAPLEVLKIVMEHCIISSPFPVVRWALPFMIGLTKLAQLFVEGEVEQDGTSSVIPDWPPPAAPVNKLLPAVAS